MGLPVTTLNNTQLYLRYPKLPEPPENADTNFMIFYGGLQSWYSDFTRILQRDREDILASIKKLTP